MGKKDSTKNRKAPKKGELTVRVHHSSGDPLDGIRVELREEDDESVIASNATDEDGEVCFKGVMLGEPVNIWVNGEDVSMKWVLERASEEANIEYDDDFDPVERDLEASEDEEEAEDDEDEDESGDGSEEELEL